MINNLSIIGAGAWGSALAIALSSKFDTIYLHTHTKAQVTTLKTKHPALSVPYPENINLIYGWKTLAQTNNILIATPSHAFSEILKNIKTSLKPEHTLAWLTKGFDTNQHCFLHESFEKILPNKHGCVISGPSFAFEVATNKPTALVVASKDKNTRNHFAELIQNNTLRAYTNPDIIGVEVGGTIKNILAIATGIASGLGYGANTQAALITRGLAEMIRFGKNLGAKHTTFVGLSGVGDLMLTCSDDLSRNRRFGKEIARQYDIKKTLKNIGATVEGLYALDAIMLIAKEKQIKMPICEQVYYVTQGIITPDESVNNLMSRIQINE